MTRTPHFRYFWDKCNNNSAIVADVRTFKCRRHYLGLVIASALRYSFWKHAKRAAFPITRAQFRLFKSTGEKPTFSGFNRHA